MADSDKPITDHEFQPCDHPKQVCFRRDACHRMVGWDTVCLAPRSAHAPNAEPLNLCVDGETQAPGKDYSIEGSTITFAAPKAEPEVQLSNFDIPDLYQLAFMPGQFRCPVCGFQLCKQTLSMSQGIIGTSEEDRQNEQCPNDGAEMVHVTYRETVAVFEKRCFEEIAKVSAVTGERDYYTEAYRRTLEEQRATLAELAQARADLATAKDEGLREGLETAARLCLRTKKTKTLINVIRNLIDAPTEAQKAMKLNVSYESSIYVKGLDMTCPLCNTLVPSGTAHQCSYSPPPDSLLPKREKKASK